MGGLNLVFLFVLLVAATGFGQAAFVRYWTDRRLKREFNMAYTGLSSSAGWWVSLGLLGELKLGFRDSGEVRWVDVPAVALLDIGVSQSDLAAMVPHQIYQLSPLGCALTRITRAVLLEKVADIKSEGVKP